MSRMILRLMAAWLTAVPLLAAAGPVNINTADAATLARELNGVGAAKARQIIAFRTANGPFERAEDLAQVKGIGKRLVDLNLANIRLEGKDKD